MHNRTTYAKSTRKSLVRRFFVGIINFLYPNVFCDIINWLSKKETYSKQKRGFWYASGNTRHYFDEYYFEEPIRMPFEDIEVNVTQRWNERLIRVYGDYMQLPPEGKRKIHGIEVYKLKKS